MNDRLLRIRAEQCRRLAASSHCVRRKVAAIILNPERNQVLVDGYNGGPRGGTRLCGTDTLCDRDLHQIESGTRTEVGCHHAEQNAVANAANLGVSLAGSWLLSTTPPCLACARILHHAGITKVVCLGGDVYASEGTAYLIKHGVPVEVLPEI